MDQDNKQNTSGQVSGKDLPPLSGTGVDVKTPEEVSKKVSVDNDVPVKPEPVKAKPVSASAIPDNEGLPPLETAEDETFDLGLVDKNKKEESGGEKEEDLKEVEKIEKATLPPLPATDVNETSESLKEVKEMSEINSENQETPPPLPPEEPPVAPGKIEEKPLTTEGIDMGDDGEEGKKKGKKKISKKTIVGGLIALVLLIGVPVLALNLDYFRGDVRERAYLIEDPDPTPTGHATCKEDCLKAGGGSYACSYLPPCGTPTPTKKPTATPTGHATCKEDCLKAGGGSYACGYLPPCSETPTPTNGGICTSNNECAKDNSLTGCFYVSGGGWFCKSSTTSPTSTPTPWEPPDECVKNGECLQPGMLCCSGLIMKFTKPTDDLYCHVTETKCVSGGTGTSTSTPTSTKTPTEKPTVGVCMNIKIYTLQESVWTETAVAEVGQYAVVGDTVRLALRGNSSAFVNGRFRVTVGGVVGSWVTTSKKNGNGELYLDYQLENGGSYGVEGEIRK